MKKLILIGLFVCAVAQAQVYPATTTTPAAGRVPRADTSGFINGAWLAGDYYGHQNLRAWPGKLANMLRSTSATATVAYIGDSWTAGDQITSVLRSSLQGQFGNTGIGYVSFAAIDSPPTGITLTTTGTWVDKNGNSDTTARGVDLYETTSTVTSSAKSFSTTATSIVIHYIIQAGGGTFTWQIDGGGTTAVDTSSGTPGYATTTISSLSNASHTLAINVTVAGSAGVTLLGADCQISGGGVRLHRIGHSGATTGNYIGVNAANWQTGLSTLAPDLVCLMLYVNDANAAITPASVSANLITLIGRVRAAVPSADVIIVPQADSGLTWTYPIAQYASVERALVATSFVGFVDAVQALGPYSSNAWSYWLGNNHPNGTGGQAYTNLLMGYLLYGARVNTGLYGNFLFGVNPISDDNTNRLQVNGSVKATGGFTNGTHTAVLGGDQVITAGSVPFVDATSGLLAQNATRLFWDNTNYRLCVGCNNAATRLQVGDMGTGVNTVLTVTTTGNHAAQANYVGNTTWAVGLGAFSGNGNNFQWSQGGNKVLDIATNGQQTLLGVTFASLGTPANGTICYCSDCTVAATCAGSGTGALAKRLNGAWVCN